MEKIIKGFGELPSHNRIYFKTTTGTAFFYEFEDLEYAIIERNGIEKKYLFQKVNSRKKGVVVEEVITGQVSYYLKTKVAYAQSFGITGGLGVDLGRRDDEEYFYLKKVNNSKLTHFGSNRAWNRSFRKKAIKFFKDYPELSNKVDKNEYKKRIIKSIVNFYNQNCN